MFNKVVLIGRWVRDLELKVMPGSGTAMLKSTIAVDRAYQKDKDRESDFINIIAWAKTAEFAAQYSEKGKLVVIEGRIQTGSYENKDGKKVYTFDVVAENIKPIEWVKKSDFSPIDPIDTGDLPF